MDPSLNVGFHTNFTIAMFQKEIEVSMEENTFCCYFEATFMKWNLGITPEINLENNSETAVNAENYPEKTIGK